MNPDQAPTILSRREFLNASAGLAAAAAVPGIISSSVRAADAPAPSAPAKPQKMIGLQIGAISFVDEGVNQVLDILQERGQVNTLFLSTFTCDNATGGRQIRGFPFPDHGKQEYDNFRGGNFATPHPQFYTDTVLKDTKAPDLGDVDILEMVLPEAKKRGMKVFAWNYNVFRPDLPNVETVQERNLHGQRVATGCAYNPDYRNFVVDLTRDHCTSYDIDGVMWGSEYQGPLNYLITAGGWSGHGTTACFCDFHRAEAKKRGIDPDRAVAGYLKLEQLMAQARASNRPNDGYFVEFWRLLLNYPEILAWEKLWTDGKHSTYADIYRTAKAVRKELQVGFHIWQEVAYSPFNRAEHEYAELAKYADFFKPALYNIVAGPRYVRQINNVNSALFRDVPPAELMEFTNHLLNYEEKSIAEIPATGLSTDFVSRETKRTLADLPASCHVYPGIDLGIPTAGLIRTVTPDDVEAATTAAFQAGAQGVIFCRKYSEIRLDSISGGGRAVKALS